MKELIAKEKLGLRVLISIILSILINALTCCFMIIGAAIGGGGHLACIVAIIWIFALF